MLFEGKKENIVTFFFFLTNLHSSLWKEDLVKCLNDGNIYRDRECICKISHFD